MPLYRPIFRIKYARRTSWWDCGDPLEATFWKLRLATSIGRWPTSWTSGGRNSGAVFRNILPGISRCGRWLNRWYKFPLHLFWSPQRESLSQTPRNRIPGRQSSSVSAGRRIVGAETRWDGQKGVASVLLRSRQRTSVNQRRRDSGRHSMSLGWQGSRPKRNTENGSETFCPARDVLTRTVIQRGSPLVTLSPGLEAWSHASYSETRKGPSAAFFPSTSKSARRLASCLKRQYSLGS